MEWRGLPHPPSPTSPPSEPCTFPDVALVPAVWRDRVAIAAYCVGAAESSLLQKRDVTCYFAGDFLAAQHMSATKKEVTFSPAAPNLQLMPLQPKLPLPKA